MHRQLLSRYQQELQAELDSILSWWKQNMLDSSHGFKGEVNHNNQPVPNAPKGLVMMSRILWTFSAAYQWGKKKEHLEMADAAYKELLQQFKDGTFGGFYWSVDHNGNPLAQRKQLYGQAFALYALTEYAAATHHDKALLQAQEVFHFMEEKGKDLDQGGYWEARDRDGSLLEDARLSEKDPNVAKSMNTHLHILEAYTRLAMEWPNEKLLSALNGLLSIFKDRIIKPSTSRQQLYFSADWIPVGDFESYGHDIEASWLLYEAASVPGLENRKQEFGELAFQMAGASSIAIDKDGGLFYERDLAQDHLNKEKHWWPQAEAMVGFFNAWEIGNDDMNLDRSLKAWEFVKNNLLDKKSGEWFWGIGEDGKPLEMPKAGFWKCPYHNGRACLELIKRIGKRIH
jgi:mannobiose 2-epimerase